jgi:hypothetical protein
MFANIAGNVLSRVGIQVLFDERNAAGRAFDIDNYCANTAEFHF